MIQNNKIILDDNQEVRESDVKLQLEEFDKLKNFKNYKTYNNAKHVIKNTLNYLSQLQHLFNKQKCRLKYIYF